MENVQKMSGWFSHQRHETSETQPKRQEKNGNIVKWRNLCVCVSVNMYQAVMK